MTDKSNPSAIPGELQSVHPKLTGCSQHSPPLPPQAPSQPLPQLSLRHLTHLLGFWSEVWGRTTLTGGASHLPLTRHKGHSTAARTPGGASRGLQNGRGRAQPRSSHAPGAAGLGERAPSPFLEAHRFAASRSLSGIPCRGAKCPLSTPASSLPSMTTGHTAKFGSHAPSLPCTATRAHRCSTSRSTASTGS